jgi:hypothetical protein
MSRWAPCSLFGATSVLGRILWPAITLLGGISMTVNARREAKREPSAKSAADEAGRPCEPKS